MLIKSCLHIYNNLIVSMDVFTFYVSKIIWYLIIMENAMHPTNEVMLISRFDGFLWWEYKKKLVDLIIGHIKPAKWMFKMVICTTSK